MIDSSFRRIRLPHISFLFQMLLVESSVFRMPISLSDEDKILAIYTFLITSCIGLLLMIIMIDCSFVEDDEVSTTKKAYASHPLFQRMFRDLNREDNPIQLGYIKNGRFSPLHDVSMEKDVLYCSYGNQVESVSYVLSVEKNLIRPRWLDYVYMSKMINGVVRHILLKDYIALKYNLTFT